MNDAHTPDPARTRQVKQHEPQRVGVQRADLRPRDEARAAQAAHERVQQVEHLLRRPAVLGHAQLDAQQLHERDKGDRAVRRAEAVVGVGLQRRVGLEVVPPVECKRLFRNCVQRGVGILRRRARRGMRDCVRARARAKAAASPLAAASASSASSSPRSLLLPPPPQDTQALPPPLQ